MSFLDRIRSRSKSIPPNATFRLTEQGREKVINEFSGDTKGRILVALETGGTSDVDEISQKSGISRGQVEKMVPALVRGGYIQYVSASMSGED